MATNAKYKMYVTGTGWVEYHFTTNVDQVAITSNKKFVTTDVTVNGVGFSLNTVNANNTDAQNRGASVVIYGTDIKMSNSNNTTLKAAIEAAAASGAPDEYIKSASVSNNVLTLKKKDNTTVTFTNTTYESKAAASGGTAVSLVTTGEKYSWNNMVPNSRTVNGKALSSNITLYATDIELSSSDSTKVGAAIASLQASASGMTHSYAISNESDNAQNRKFNPSVTGNIVEALNTYGHATITLSAGSQPPYQTSNLYAGFETMGGTTIRLCDLKVGDTIFIDDIFVPDVWVSDVGDMGSTTFSVTFSVLESFDLVWEIIKDKPNTLAGYGITDAVSSSDTRLTNARTPTAHADTSGAYGKGTTSNYGHVKLGATDQNGATAADGVAAPNGHTHSQYLTSHQSLSNYYTKSECDNKFQKKVYVQSSEPASGMSAGDILIQTS